MSLFSFLVPTRHRVQLVHRLFKSIVDTTAMLDGLEIVLGIDSDDEESKAISNGALQIKKVVSPPGSTMGMLNSSCFDVSAGRYVMLLNDDVILRTKNWDQIISAVASLYQDDVCLIHVNDLLFRDKLCTFPILSRRACLEIGVCPSEYRRYRIDDHIYDIYRLLARLGHQRTVYLPDVIFEHENYTIQAQGHQSHEFRSVDNKVYIPDQEIIKEDARLFEETFGERQEAAIKLARLIDQSRYERFLDSQTVMNRSILANSRGSPRAKKGGVVEPVYYPKTYSEESVRTTIAVVTSDFRKEHAQKCLSSIKEYTSNYDLIISDNNATRDFSHPREINRILQAVRSDFLVIMDDDVFVEPGWLDGLLRSIDDATAVVVPMHKDRNGMFSFSGVYLAGDDKGTHGHTVDKPDFPRAVQCYCSALLLIDMRKCGHIFMDEAYEKYFFDLVHSLRVWELGLKAVCTPDVVVTHLGGATLNHGSVRADEVLKRDCEIFVKDWVDSGRLAKIGEEMWQKDPYLKALRETPQRTRWLFNNLEQLTLGDFESRVKELLGASHDYPLFRYALMQRVYWGIPVLIKKVIRHGIEEGISGFRAGKPGHAKERNQEQLPRWESLKFYLLLGSQAIAMFAMRPVVGRILRRLIGAKKYSELKRWWNDLISNKRTKS